MVDSTSATYAPHTTAGALKRILILPLILSKIMLSAPLVYMTISSVFPLCITTDIHLRVLSNGSMANTYKYQIININVYQMTLQQLNLNKIMP